MRPPYLRLLLAFTLVVDAKRHKSKPLVASNLQQSVEDLPRYSAPFTGPAEGLLPTDSQVATINAYLTNIKTTLDVFLRMTAMKAEDEDAQLEVLKNIYAPIRILLEAEYAHRILNPAKADDVEEKPEKTKKAKKAKKPKKAKKIKKPKKAKVKKTKKPKVKKTKKPKKAKKPKIKKPKLKVKKPKKPKFKKPKKK